MTFLPPQIKICSGHAFTPSLERLGISAKTIRVDLRRTHELNSDRPWGAPDSPLLEQETYVEGSQHPTGISFNNSFEDVFPNEYPNIKTYIEEVLSPKKGAAIAIEVGGIGSTMFSGFSEGFFQRTAGVALTDYRNKLGPDLTKNDERRNHTVIPGDILSPDTKKAVGKFLDGQKADLIVSRMVLGIETLPDAPHFLGKQADYWYQQLATGGLIFSELPHSFTPFMGNWVNLINDSYEGKLKVQHALNASNRSFIRLQKLEGAPEHLPLVPLI